MSYSDDVKTIMANCESALKTALEATNAYEEYQTVSKRIKTLETEIKDIHSEISEVSNNLNYYDAETPKEAKIKELMQTENEKRNILLEAKKARSKIDLTHAISNDEFESITDTYDTQLIEIANTQSEEVISKIKELKALLDESQSINRTIEGYNNNFIRVYGQTKGIGIRAKRFGNLKKELDHIFRNKDFYHI